MPSNNGANTARESAYLLSKTLLCIPYATSAERQKRRTSLLNTSGCSMLLTCPAFEMMASCALGIDAWSCRAMCKGLRRSSSPFSTSVATSMFGSRSVVSTSADDNDMAESLGMRTIKLLRQPPQDKPRMCARSIPITSRNPARD